jgi:hypothetical protein
LPKVQALEVNPKLLKVSVSIEELTETLSESLMVKDVSELK